MFEFDLVIFVVWFVQRNLDQLEALSKKLKAKTLRSEATSQSIAATRLIFFFISSLRVMHNCTKLVGTRFQLFELSNLGLKGTCEFNHWFFIL